VSDTLFGDDIGRQEMKPWQRSAIDPKTLARRADPVTSHAAARSLSGRAGTMRRRLLEVFSDGLGYTAEEAASLAGYGPADGSWKRVSDLLTLGLLRDTGRTRIASTGRRQRVLEITEDGTAVFA
jgi:hypothetical protein